MVMRSKRRDSTQLAERAGAGARLVERVAAVVVDVVVVLMMKKMLLLRKWIACSACWGSINHGMRERPVGGPVERHDAI